jgi:hypothetical protein
VVKVVKILVKMEKVENMGKILAILERKNRYDTISSEISVTVIMLHDIMYAITWSKVQMYTYCQRYRKQIKCAFPVNILRRTKDLCHSQII